MNVPDYRTLLGGYVANILDEDERTMVDTHLADCHECQQELAMLSDTSHRLANTALANNALADNALVDQEFPDIAQLEADGASLSNDLILARTLDAARSERSRAKRPRMLAAAAAVAALLIGGGVAGAAINSSSSSPPAAVASIAGGRTFTAHDAATGVGMRVTVIPQQAGFTRLQAQMTNEPPNYHCQMIAVTDSGQQQVVSSWAVGPHGSGEVGTRVNGSVSAPASQIASIEVRALSGQHIVSVTTN